MKQLTFMLTVLGTLTLVAQSAKEQIDQQIWIKFTQAWEANDGEAFNAIHSDDVWRINPGRLLIGNEYKSRNAERMQGQRKEQIIEFSFETRTSNGDHAYEVGYYRITDTSQEVQRYFVGRFHVAMKKIEGKWKIVQDWDTGEINGIEITAESVENREFIHFE